jgi:hypothetical protein
VPAFDRTVRAKEDLDWLPPSFKAVRWLVAAGIWTGLAGLFGVLIAIAKGAFVFYGKGLVLLFAGGYYAGDRAARAVLRRRLGALAHGDIAPEKLAKEPDGELVHVRGRVKVLEETIEGVLIPEERCVLRRVVFSLGGDCWVHEAGVDFHLVGENGEIVLVVVDGARVIAPEPERRKLEGELALAVQDLTREKSQRGRRVDGGGLVLRTQYAGAAVTAGEVRIRPGDVVEIVAYKSRSVDPTVVSRLERETPMRVTLRGGKELPLLVSPVAS